MEQIPSISWHPDADNAAIKIRAKVLREIREFFHERDVMEVETPLLCQTAATDPHLQSLPVSLDPDLKKSFFLQTSPEYAMKRLLAAGSGSIYQICKAFRGFESGRYHNPEFTLLEWYRIGFDHHQLMDEMDLLLGTVLDMGKARRCSYQALFEEHFNLNPHDASLEELRLCANMHGIVLGSDSENFDRTDWLQILMSHQIEPTLGFSAPVIVYDFPEEQAALAKLRGVSETLSGKTIYVAERFEVFIQGIELANGYHELLDPDEQLSRFLKDCEQRLKLGLPERPIDYRLIAAMRQGLPSCAGVAMGIDRLLLIKMGRKKLKEIITFTIENA